MEKSYEMKGNFMGRDGPRASRRKTAFNRQIFISVISILRREGICAQHCVQLGTEPKQWQENCTDACP
jgi:hypothetical protein